MTRHGRHWHGRAAMLGVCVAASMVTSAGAMAGGKETLATPTQQHAETPAVAERTVRHFVIAAMQIERLAKKAEEVEANVPQRVLNKQAKRIIDATPHVDRESYRALQQAVRENDRIRAHVQQTARELRQELYAASAPLQGHRR